MSFLLLMFCSNWSFCKFLVDVDSSGIIPPAIPYVVPQLQPLSVHGCSQHSPNPPRPCYALLSLSLLAVLTPICSIALAQHLCAPFNLAVHMLVRNWVQRSGSAPPCLCSLLFTPVCNTYMVQQPCGSAHCPCTPCCLIQWPHGLLSSPTHQCSLNDKHAHLHMHGFFVICKYCCFVINFRTFPKPTGFGKLR
ncbi:hypothetical protein LguiA_029750 [Lonicera macranthoides]